MTTPAFSGLSRPAPDDGLAVGDFAINRRLPNPAALTFAPGVVTSHGRCHSTDDIRQYLVMADRLGLDGAANFSWQEIHPF